MKMKMMLTEQQYLDNIRVDLSKHLQSWIDDELMDDEGRNEAIQNLAKLNSMSLQEIIDLMKDRCWDIESAFEFLINAAINIKVKLDVCSGWST